MAQISYSPFLDKTTTRCSGLTSRAWAPLIRFTTVVSNVGIPNERIITVSTLVRRGPTKNPFDAYRCLSVGFVPPYKYGAG